MDDAEGFIAGLKISLQHLKDPRVTGRCDHSLLEIIGGVAFSKRQQLGAMLMSRQQHEHAGRNWHANSCSPCWRDANMAPGEAIRSQLSQIRQ